MKTWKTWIWYGLALIGPCAFVGGLIAITQPRRDRDAADDQAHDQHKFFCTRIADNLDSLITSRHDRPEAFHDRAAGAEWFIVNAVRLCTGHDNVPDYGDAIVAGDDDAIAQALVNFEHQLGAKP